MTSIFHFGYFEDFGVDVNGTHVWTITAFQNSNALSAIEVPANTDFDVEIPLPGSQGNVTTLPFDIGLVVPYLPKGTQGPDIIVTNLFVWPYSGNNGTKFATFHLENPTGSVQYQEMAFSVVAGGVSFKP